MEFRVRNVLGLVVLNYVAKKGTQRVTRESSNSSANERVYSRHPPLEPCVHLHPEKLVLRVWSDGQETAAILYHDKHKNRARSKCPQHESSAETHFIVKQIQAEAHTILSLNV